MSQRTLMEPVGPNAATGEQPTERLRRDFTLPPQDPLAGEDLGQQLEVTARAFRRLRQSQVTPDAQTVDFWCQGFPGSQEHARLFRDLHSYDPHAADRLADAMTSMPEAGGQFLGFRLLMELGRGGFARVYLAEQEALAHRHVVAKGAADLWGEAHNLAQMQHPNIVPVYSVHQHGPFQAVCMPFLGWTTLQDVLLRVEGQAALPESGSALLAFLKSLPPEAIHYEGTNDPAAAAPAASFAESLAGLSYVEAIVWLSAQLADGLAHAHEHGIVHHDLKPANVLLANDGRPMILDFNAAEDTKDQADALVACIAGTLPYMAPEQLAAAQGHEVPLDGRSDLYAFGVIMFELLTGRYPFRHRNATLGVIFDHIIEDRMGAPPRLTTWNPAISPALEAIVRRCLEPDPANRYQTARALHDDLLRQHAHQPLLHVAEPSRRERVRKWIRRHPHVFAALPVVAFAAILMTVAGGVSMLRGRQLEQLHQLEMQRQERQKEREQAVAAWTALRDEMRTVQFLLYTRTNEPDQRAKGVALGTRLANAYDVLGQPSWQEAGLAAALMPAEREQLGESMGEILLLVARALALQQADEANADRRRELLDTAELMNERAAACSPHAAASPALWRQRATLLSALGRLADAEQCQAKADAMALRSAADYYWLASDHVSRGRLREALPLLNKATHLDPGNFWAWFVLASCYDRLIVDGRAEACYSTSIALRPDFAWAYFNRGLALLRQNMYDAARIDFDTALRLHPELTEAYLNRALAYQGLAQYRQADEDLTAAVERGGPTRLYFLRARIRHKLGDKEGARRDREEGLRLPPRDEKSWVTRGYFRMSDDPQAALADFDEALQLNPRSIDALQNKAHVLAERLGRNQEALDVMNRALALHPDSVKARGGRGVLHARLGQRDAALRDAEESLRRDSSPLRLYQVACIYALTSKQQADDRLQAFQLLSAALRKGYGFNLLEADHDLDPIRGYPEFRRLVDAARSLRPAAPVPRSSFSAREAPGER